MKKICTFNEFCLMKEDSNSSSKTVLYPLGYGGIGLYPDADFMASSADAVFYLSIDKRLYNNGDNAPFNITHLPGHKQWGDMANSGEDEPHSIRHIAGRVVSPKDSILPGKSIPFKSFVKLVNNPKEIIPPCSKIPN